MNTIHKLSDLTGVSYGRIEYMMRKPDKYTLPSHQEINDMWDDQQAWLKWKNTGQTYPDGFVMPTLAE